MPYGLYISAEGAHAQSKRLEAVANNLANVDTVGFKRDLALFQARYAEAIEQGAGMPGNGSVDDLGGGVLVQQTQTDYSAGPLKRTMVPTDMAIEGDGFFMVQKDGEVFLTRAGDFQMTSDGQLTTQQGYPVLNDAGSPIEIEPANGPWELTPSGTIRQRGVVQNLAVVKPASLGDLVKTGENLFRPLAETEPVAAGQRHVVSGYLEASAVRPTTELMEMIEASRAVEINLSMMQTQDQMLSALVNRILRP
ncbi:MAG: flagellar basal-body rod protein FlgF [Pirellulales bacterium]|nr:flagellar basal-body rod protein FlgF [Pirellulales bacterium]